MITSFVHFMPKLNAIPQPFLRNLVHSFNIRVCCSSQPAADLGAKPQEVLAVVWDARVAALEEVGAVDQLMIMSGCRSSRAGQMDKYLIPA
jgi:hypothetical protein